MSVTIAHLAPCCERGDCDCRCHMDHLQIEAMTRPGVDAWAAKKHFDINVYWHPTKGTP
jgi:hypothetical protein